MNVNKAGLELIEHFEGLKLDAYKCPAGKLTIGFGHVGSDVYPGEHITEAQAEDILAHDLAKFSTGVDAMTEDCNENQFSAMVSLAYNIGLQNFATSSVRKYHNAGQTQLAGDAFLKWNKAHTAKGFVVLDGLTKRREAERELYLEEPA